MSSPDPELELDLDLQFLPAWARQPATTNRYAGHPGEAGERREDRDRRGFRDERPRGPRPGGPRRDDRRPDRGATSHRTGHGPEHGRGPRPPLADRPPLPAGFVVHFLPEEAGLEQLARQIRHTGRAYPLLDIAHLILKRPERYHLEFRAVAREGAPAPALWISSLDDTVWLNEGEAARHILDRHFDTFYKAIRTPTEKPKGTYTFVARCGLSGVILGPPNHHDYQNALRRLHTARFERMPFEAFKARIQIVRDESVVQQWLEEQSYTTEYECLNLPEPLRLPSLDAARQHFREVHQPNVIRAVDRFVVRTPAARELLPPPLRALARRELDLQHRFPLKLITLLSDRLTRAGLQLFKINKTALHICAARPRFLDLEANPASDSVRRILEAVTAQPGLNRRQLLEKLGVPLPPPAPEGQAAAEAPPPSPELAGLIADLHWLIHQGHVIEYADGRLEAAKRPPPRPTPPPPKPAAPVPAKEPPPVPAQAAPAADPAGDAVPPPPATEQAVAVPPEEPVPSPS